MYSRKLRRICKLNEQFVLVLICSYVFKVHYESKTLQEEEEIGGRKVGAGTKKASLFAWATLQSIPEETIISPHILEFLEQTLEPIPSQGKSSPFPSPGECIEQN